MSTHESVLHSYDSFMSTLSLSAIVSWRMPLQRVAKTCMPLNKEANRATCVQESIGKDKTASAHQANTSPPGDVEKHAQRETTRHEQSKASAHTQTIEINGTDRRHSMLEIKGRTINSLTAISFVHMHILTLRDNHGDHHACRQTQSNLTKDMGAHMLTPAIQLNHAIGLLLLA